MTAPTPTAGTASDGYRAAPAPHHYEAATADWGLRPRCECGQPRGAAVHLTVPNPREASE